MADFSTTDLLRLIEGSSPLVRKCWLDNRARIAGEYVARLESFLKNRERFALRWKEESALFEPFSGMDEATVIAARQVVSQGLCNEAPTESETRLALRQFARQRDDQTSLVALCHHVIEAWAEEWVKRLIDTRSQKDFPDEYLREKIIRAHYVMIRGAVRRWTSAATMIVLRDWGSPMLISALCHLDPSRAGLLKTLRMVFGWDLHEATEYLKSREER